MKEHQAHQQRDALHRKYAYSGWIVASAIGMLWFAIRESDKAARRRQDSAQTPLTTTPIVPSRRWCSRAWSWLKTEHRPNPAKRHELVLRRCVYPLVLLALGVFIWWYGAHLGGAWFTTSLQIAVLALSFAVLIVSVTTGWSFIVGALAFFVPSGILLWEVSLSPIINHTIGSPPEAPDWADPVNALATVALVAAGAFAPGQKTVWQN
ncbi:hypothetical protein [Curtobacterium herbarum]|uniref:Histidine kinase n=1 Tax=Curtobacterium herbarum TaxID=150122 RepID=A0ABN1ZC04_9MICO|nr:hypothetical protein [Curtobacterium herbarum]MBM7473771.1 hypothetical protein [Curtobacterium herbarum]MCS6544897.1 hypothetical protein [Curtobacterium herbarum]